MAQDNPVRKARQIPPEERRRFVRVRREVYMGCRVVGAPPPDVDVSTRNLAGGGMQISAPKPLAIGARLQLFVNMQAACIQFNMEGRVVWCERNPTLGSYNIGICFLGLDAMQRKNVMALIGLPTEGMDAMERRQFIRLRKRLLVDFKAQRMLSRWRTGTTRDMSAGGVALLVQDRVAPATSLEMKIHLDDSAATVLELVGGVIECTPAKEVPGQWQLSVRFITPPKETISRLGAYISDILQSHRPEALPEPPTTGA